MLLALGQKNPESLDPFEGFIRVRIAGLSEEIERLNAETARLAEDHKAAEQATAEAVGQYLGVAASLEAYYQGKAKAARPAAPPAPSPVAPAPVPEPGPPSPEVPTPAADGQDSEPRS